MATFSLKSGDTRPILEVALKNPDGSAHDLTGATEFKLHIYVNGTVLVRDMVKEGDDADGVLRYSWVAADWDEDNLPTVNVYDTVELPMEYQVSDGTTTMTFPNNGYDTLVIASGLA